MTLNYDRLMTLPSVETSQSYVERDTILYALGIGQGQSNGREPVDLRYVYENRLVAFPTMALVLAEAGGAWLAEPANGIDMARVVHAEQSVTFGAPLKPAGSVTSEARVEAIYDKGPGKGALLVSSRTVRDEASGETIAVGRSTLMLLGQGGFRSHGDQPVAPPPPAAAAAPRPADLAIELPTREEQAMIYRLSGDYMILHIDPERAASLGFARPILHGLCTYAIAARAAVHALCADDPHRLQSLNCRFASPVYPGETLRTEFWRMSGDEALFQTKVVERDVVVLSHGVVRTRGLGVPPETAP